MRTALVVLLLLTLGACTAFAPEPMTAERCATIDWEAQGYADGRAGRGADALQRRLSDCAPFGKGDAGALSAGHDAGVAVYCTPENGYRLGLAGRGASRICPPETARAFELAYRDGRSESWRYRPQVGFGFGFGSGRIGYGYGLGVHAPYRPHYRRGYVVQGDWYRDDPYWP